MIITNDPLSLATFFPHGNGRHHKYILCVWTDNEEEIAFEFIAMEAVFSTTMQLMRKQMMSVLPNIDKTLKELHGTKTLKTRLQDRLRNFKTEVNRIQARIHGLRRTLIDLLEEDQDLLLMNLTQLQREPDSSWDADMDTDEVGGWVPYRSCRTNSLHKSIDRGRSK